MAELLEELLRCGAERGAQAAAAANDEPGGGRAGGEGLDVGGPGARGMALDHLGFAVRSIEAAAAFYARLGLRVEGEELVEHERVRVAMLPVGGSRIELLEGVGEDAAVSRFIARRGEGMHHVALRVADVDRRFADLRAAGVRLASDAVRVGAGGHRYFFVHPEATGGVLLELVGSG